MNRRERFHGAVNGDKIDRVPVVAWMHFVTGYMTGDQTAERNAEFFTHYNFDIAKVVSDYRIPLPSGMETIETVDDFSKLGKLSIEDPFFVEQLNLLTGLRRRLGDDWPIVDTFFDPIQFLLRKCGFSTMKLIFDNPGKAKPMLEAATESIINYVHKLEEIGIDGAFYSTRAAAQKECPQGFSDSEFEELMKPYDMAILSEMKDVVSMLHACKSHLDLSRVDDYPHRVLSWADLDPTCPTMAQVRATTDMCLMGGINQAKVIEQSMPQIRADIDSALAVNEGQRFILSPGCTIGSNAPDHVIATIASYAK